MRAQLEKLIRLNKTRADFAEKFEELIESYNAGSQNIEELFEELLKLSRNLSEEQERHVRENMTEEELVIFDILTRPSPELSADERAEVMEQKLRIPHRIPSALRREPPSSRHRQGCDHVMNVLEFKIRQLLRNPGFTVAVGSNT